MLKKYSVLFFFLLTTCFGYGQTKEIDSLKTALLEPSVHDTTKIGLYLDLGNAYGTLNLDSVGKYSRLAINLSEFSKFKYGRTNAQLGRYYLKEGQIDSSRYYLKKSIDIARAKADTLLQINAYTLYALTLRDGTDFEEKVQLGHKVIDLAKNNGYQLARSQFNLSVLYGDAGFNELSVKYLELALKNIDENNEDEFSTLSGILSNLIFFELQEESVDSAKIKTYLSKSLELCQKSKSPKLCHYYYLREGEYFGKIKQFDKAEKAFNNSLEEAKKLRDPYTIMFAYICLGEHFVNTKNPKKAIYNFKKFEELIDDSSIPYIEVWAYEHWAKAEKMAGNYKNAHKYLEKYVIINDSINSKNNKTSAANADAKFETEKKDKEIAEQQLALANQKSAIQESKSKTRTMTILIVSLLLGSILLWFSFRQRQKRMQQQLVAIEREQEVRTLESLMLGEEKERFRIAKELHDGVNGDLAAIKFKLTSLLETNNQVINEAVAMLDTSSEQVRAISHNLVPPSLRDFNLLEAVEAYCENMNAIHEPEIIFQHLGNAIVLEKKQEANLFRVIQELVTNSIKHAEAKEIHVQLSNREGNLQLTVEDDGIGFDLINVKRDGIGMQNIKSRVDYLGGLMDIKSDTKGSSFIITIADKPKKT